MSQADKIRTYVNKTFIEPAKKAGRTAVEVVSGDVHKDMRFDNRMPDVCSALDAKKFQDDYGVVLSKRAGPHRGSTVTWTFSLRAR